MCLFAGHAGTGFSVVLIKSRGSGSKHKVQASFPAHNLAERGHRSRANAAPSQAASSLFTSRPRPPQYFFQQLICTAVCSPLAVECACQSGAGKVVTISELDDDAKNVVDRCPLTKALTALPLLGATLLLLTAQPSSAEASLQVNISRSARFACTLVRSLVDYVRSAVMLTAYSMPKCL